MVLQHKALLFSDGGQWEMGKGSASVKCWKRQELLQVLWMYRIKKREINSQLQLLCVFHSGNWQYVLWSVVIIIYLQDLRSPATQEILKRLCWTQLSERGRDVSFCLSLKPEWNNMCGPVPVPPRGKAESVQSQETFFNSTSRITMRHKYKFTFFPRLGAVYSWTMCCICSSTDLEASCSRNKYCQWLKMLLENASSSKR